MVSNLIQAQAVVETQRAKTEQWHREECSVESDGFVELVEKNHSYNFKLWHEEDKARREDMGFEYIYHAKRNIDGYNQQRNNLIETMDEWIFHH